MGLFEPGWKSKDKEKALKWIYRQKGRNPALRDAVLQSGDYEVKKAALEQITDDKLLEEIITHQELQERDVYHLRRRSAKRVSDQRVLEKLAKAGYLQAAEALTDPAICLDAATNLNFFDQTVLSTVTKEEIGLAVIWQLKKTGDWSALIAAGKKTPYEKAAREAAETLIKNSVFTAEEIAENPTWAVSARVAAISLVSNQDFCLKLAENDSNGKIRKAAKHMVTDPVIRREYCKEGIHEWEDVASDYDEVGEHVYARFKQRCKYCGIEKTKKETWRL